MKYPMRLNMVKKINLILLGFFLFIPLLFSQALNDKINPETAKNYSPYPAPAGGYITDLAGIITDKDKKFLNHIIYQTEKKTGVEIAVVTINSIFDYKGAGTTIEEFAKGLFDKWGIGNMPKNDGVLLLVATKDRKVRIELGAGYGHRKDRIAKRIIDKNIIPYFKKGKFSEGIKKGVIVIAEEFAKVRVTFAWSIVIIPVLIIFLIFVAVSLFRNGKKGWGWVVVGAIFILLIILFKIIGRIMRAASESASGLGTPGGFGGGFGGGFSGGGGATGGW